MKWKVDLFVISLHLLYSLKEKNAANQIFHCAHRQNKISKYIWISGSKEYDVPFDINLRDVNGQTVLYLACCVGNLKIVELLLKYQVKARKISGKTATLKKKKIGSKDDQSRPSMVATRTTFQTGSAATSQSSIQVSFRDNI